MNNIDIQKFFALQEEFETANKLVRLGFGELQNINLDNDFYFLPFQLLSQGFERFMKAYICIGHFEKHKTLPSFQYLRRLGHDLEKLLNDIKENYYFDQYPPKQFQIDSEFLHDNIDLKELLFILSEFGKIARYYNFDFITDSTKIGINPKESWQKFENRINPINENLLKKLMNHDTNNEVYQKITNHIIITFEKFIASLSRQIIFNTLGLTGKQITASSFFDYGLMYEGEFGKTDYRGNTSTYKETPKSVHKRSFADELKRKHNPNYKWKEITKEEFQGDWPFYSDKIIIECRYKHWCIVSIDGYDYSLNGAAAGRYKLENPHDAGMAILGKGIGDFITMALKLH
ncbi:hypothetical protein [Lentimicrobium sp. S6]|uniref:hypothetical protein n=1 Tax=Lentimicrobium sp. S6 TaxID=2735872 RepID=UPI0015516959|nr:hypothetical protein [Lentimicrobium sp. S6]NPD48023.1 hypothetical protein [Lentimicrobium sp. S6]